MNKRGVVGVSVCHKFTCTDSSVNTVNSSGVYLGNGFVITSGILFMDLLWQLKNHELDNIKPGDVIYQDICDKSDSRFTVHLPNNEKEWPEDIKEQGHLSNSIKAKKNVVEAHLQFLVFSFIVDKLFLFTPPSGESVDKARKDKISGMFLCSFAILQLVNQSDAMKNFTKITINDFAGHLQSMLKELPMLSKGDVICLETTPLCSNSQPTFLNTCSMGIVSNISPSVERLFLTDAYCSAGGEGAPAFTLRGLRWVFCGIVLAPYYMNEGQWMGITFVVPACVIFTEIISIINISRNVPSGSNNVICGSMQKHNEMFGISNKMAVLSMPAAVSDGLAYVTGGQGENASVEEACAAVVWIKAGNLWGSGTVISRSPGVVITCSHVVKGASGKEVTINLCNGRIMTGHIVYKTVPALSAVGGKHFRSTGDLWDFAVVLVQDELPCSLSLMTFIPHPGTPVVAVGFGSFKPSVLPTASAFRGCISKIIPSCDSLENDHLLDNVAPVVFQTTCTILSGASGSPVVVFTETGPLAIGIVVCNSVNSKGKIFPWMNFCLPFSAIYKHLSKFGLGTPASALSSAFSFRVLSRTKSKL